MKFKNLAIAVLFVCSGAALTAAGSYPIDVSTAPSAVLPTCGGCPPPTTCPGPGPCSLLK